jgi:hypothetical protein
MTNRRRVLPHCVALAGVALPLAIAMRAVLASAAAAAAPPSAALDAIRADQFLVVDCLLPGQVRSLGTRTTYVSARRPARTTARDCQIRGGEYVAYDRADARSALAAWLPRAEAGDLEAQVIVGEIHERGIGVAADYVAARRWYGVAAEAGSTRAQVNLGHLYERGLGVPADPVIALHWYRRAAGLPAAIELDEPPPVPPAAASATPAAPPTPASAPGASGADDTPPPELVALRADVERRLAETRALAAELERARAAEAARVAALDAAARDTAAARAAEASARAELERQRAALDTQREQLDAQRAALVRREAEVARLDAQLARATERAAGLEQRVAALERPVQQRLLAGPQLALVEPALTRTRDIVPVAFAAGAERLVVGRVTAPAGLVALTVNDATVTANELGVFTATLPVPAGEQPVNIVAVDRQGKRGELRFVLRSPAAARAAGPGATVAVPAASAALPDVDFGTYHALLIGNADYQSLSDLATPVGDVEALAAVLRSRYGFRTTVLRNATRYQLLSALNALREQLTPQDNLLVYYAGHGELDEVNQRGHWLPVDAERDSTANWVPSTAITDLLNIMRAKQVLVVADSCYSGALTRSSVARLGTAMTAAERLHWFRTMAGKRSRTALTSGGLEPVLDAGGGSHSVFAKALLDVLAANAELLDGQRLHREVAARVAYAAANLRFEQVPEYAPIRFAGHEAGEFFFVPRR